MGQVKDKWIFIQVCECVFSPLPLYAPHDKISSILPFLGLQALLGVGKTPTGFQLKPFFPIQYNGDSVISLDVSHRTPVYVTVMVENFAGLRSVLRSSKLLTDHTAPAINNVSVNADFTSTENDTNTTLFENEALIYLDVSWKVRDEESDIVMCLISVGKYRNCWACLA